MPMSIVFAMLGVSAALGSGWAYKVGENPCWCSLTS